MNDWKLAQRDPSEKLAKLHFFSYTKKHAAGEIETRITVKEFVTAETPAEAQRALDRFPLPVVLKADGLAAGKGVVIAHDRAEA